MKKTFLSILIAVSGILVYAQNYNAVTINYLGGKFEDAKKEVDKLMTDSKAQENAESDLWKLKVYSELYADSVLHKKYPDAGKEAFDALNKYIAKEPTLAKLKEDGLRSISLLYGQSFNYGRDLFKKEDWANSFNQFQMCQQLSEFIGKNGLNTNGKYTIDTTVVLYAAYAAQNSGKLPEAASRYKSLANWKVRDKEYEDIYKFVIDYDMRQKDEASFKKYLALAKELYPNDMSLWNQFEMNYMSSTSSLTDIIAKYKTEDAAGNLKEDAYITYAESFASPDKTQLSKLDSNQQNELKSVAADAFIKAFNLNNNGLYAFNAGVLYYNLRGEDAKLKPLREEVIKQQHEMATKATEWLEKSYDILKAKGTREKNESNSLNRSVDYLANLYLWKRDKSRGSNTKDYDAFDTKYKLYDSEHDKYKL